MAGTQFPNTMRFDPYKNFKFRVMYNGQPVAGVSKVSGLTRTTQVVSHREGGDPSMVRKSPGQTEYAPITLERGVTFDLDFEAWATKVWNRANQVGQEVSLKDFRRDITIQLLNEAGQVVIAYNVFRCWVSEYVAMPELDASGNATAIQSIRIENEGWERDMSYTEPTEPQFAWPS